MWLTSNLVPILSVMLLAAGTASLWAAIEAAWRTPKSLLQVLWERYAASYQGHADYLLETRSPQRFAGEQALIALVAAVGAYVLTESLLAAALGAAGAVVLPLVQLRMRVQTRRRRLVQQIAPALQFIANTTQVTANLVEILSLVGQHLKGPLAEELTLIVSSNRLGQTLEEGLQRMMHRCSDPFVTAMASAIRLGRRSGGNMSETLRRIAQVTRESLRIELELQSKTKGQRMQLVLIVALFPLTLLLISKGLPMVWEPLTEHPIGLLALVGSSLLVGAAALLASRIISTRNL